MLRLALAGLLAVAQMPAWAQSDDMTSAIMPQEGVSVTHGPKRAPSSYKEMADMYRAFGQGGRALETLAEGAQLGEIASIRELVNLHFNSGSGIFNLRSGLAWAARGAELGDDDLQKRVARIYTNGISVGNDALPADPATALRYWALCAKKSAECQYWQGLVMLSLGDANGYPIIKQGAAKGEPNSLLWMARAVSVGGYGMARNPMVAAGLYLVASGRGVAGAAESAQEILMELDESQRAAAHKYAAQVEASLASSGSASMEMRRRMRPVRPQHPAFDGSVFGTQIQSKAASALNHAIDR